MSDGTAWWLERERGLAMADYVPDDDYDEPVRYARRVRDCPECGKPGCCEACPAWPYDVDVDGDEDEEEGTE